MAPGPAQLALGPALSSLRVGLVSPYDLSLPGGVQAQVLGLARFLVDRGDEALVIGPGLPDGVVGIDLGASVSIPGNGSKVPISISARSGKVIREAAGEIDLLHVHEPLMPMASLLAARSGIPSIGTFHAASGSLGRFAYRVTGPLARRALSSMLALTAVSRAASAGLPRGVEVQIIPNALDVARFAANGPRDPLRVAFLGRDEQRKGLDVLLEAWPRVEAMVPGAHLTVMGASRDRDGMEWLGRVDDDTKASVLSSSAVLVAPQLGGESFGIVLLEGMAAGAAVVASNLDAFVAVADAGARFFPAGDSDALASALIDVLGDRAERDRLASVGLTVARSYDWSVVGPAYRALYERVLSQDRPS